MNIILQSSVVDQSDSLVTRTSIESATSKVYFDLYFKKYNWLGRKILFSYIQSFLFLNSFIEL